MAKRVVEVVSAQVVLSDTVYCACGSLFLPRVMLEIQEEEEEEQQQQQEEKKGA